MPHNLLFLRDNMTTLNIIIEEEKKEFDEIALYSDGTIHMGGSRIDKLMTWFTTAMQRAVEYERARIRESFDDWFKNGTQDVEDWADRNLPTNQGQISR